MGAHRLLAACLLCAGSACNGDDGIGGAPAESGGTTRGLDPTGGSGATPDEPDSSVGQGATVGATTESTTGTDAGSTDTGSTDTGVRPVPGRASLILSDDIDTPGVNELYRVDYLEGALTDPVKISGPAGGGVVQTQLSPEESMLFYRPFDETAQTVEYEYIPLTAGEAGSTSPMHQPPAPASGVYGIPKIFAAEAAVAYYGLSGAGAADATIYVAEVTADAVQPPERVVQTPDGITMPSEFGVSASEAWVSFRRTPVGGGPTNGWIAPLSPVDLGGAVQVSDLDQAAQGVLDAPNLVPGDQALWYQADRDVDQVREIFFVDLSGAAPAPPIKVNDPLAAGEELRPVRASPDEMRLAYCVGTDLGREIYYVVFEGGTVSAPVQLSTLGDQQASPQGLEWSPDGRWLAYLAAHVQPDTLDLYVVDMSGDVPSVPMLVTTGGVMPGSSAAAQFGPAGDWLYVTASMDGEAPELYRSDISGAQPGPIQKVSGELAENEGLPGSLYVSHDANWLVYHVDDGIMSLWMVDVSGEQPGEPQRIHGPLAPGEEIGFTVSWSSDDSVIVYRVQSQMDAPRPQFLVERDLPLEPVLVAEDPDRVIVLGSVPP